MGLWNWLFATGNGVTPNDTVSSPDSVGPSYSGGDPSGFEIVETPGVVRRSTMVLPSAWDGWPSSWNVPQWDMDSRSRFNELVDVAWACLDLNTSVLSSMPVYRTRNGRVIDAATWMANPDPMIYTSWHEFAKQLFWDYQTGEAFVLPVIRASDGYPLTFRVIPPWMVDVEMDGGSRRYRLGGPGGADVTADILHIRYKSTTDGAHGVGPLEVAGGRMLTAGVLAKYVREVAANGGVPDYTLETDVALSTADAQELLNNWVESRRANLGAPPVLDNNVQLKTHMSMSPKDMAMLEISQFTESRIAVLLGVPPSLVGLPVGDSMTYGNVSSYFDFHDRSSLKPKAVHVMAALSWWALPSTQRAELNRDEYTRPAFNERAQGYKTMHEIGAMSVDEIRAAERLTGEAPAVPSTVALTGGEQ